MAAKKKARRREPGPVGREGEMAFRESLARAARKAKNSRVRRWLTALAERGEYSEVPIREEYPGDRPAST